MTQQQPTESRTMVADPEPHAAVVSAAAAPAHSAAWAKYALAALVLLTFGRICFHDFTSWDDDHTIWNNPSFNPVTLQGVLKYWYTPFMSLYVPVTYMVWGALAYLSRVGTSDVPVVPGTLPGAPNPWIFHTASVVVHALTALVVYRMLRRFTGRDLAALAGAAVFAVHPFQVETVAWASGMKDLLCGFFTLCAVSQYAQSVELSTDADPDRARRAGNHYLFGTLLFLLGMLSKPTAIMTPALALVVDHWILGRPLRQAMKALWPWFVLAVPCVLWTKMVQPAEGIALTPLWTRPLVAGDALAFYLYKLVAPFNMATDYGRSPIYAMKQGWIYWTWVVPAAVAVAVFVLRRGRPWLVAAGLLFVAGMLPVSGLRGFLMQYYSTVADHYMYLPMFGVGVGVAFAVARYPTRATAAVLSVVVLALAVRSFFQAAHWDNNVDLYTHILSVNDRSYLAHTNLASYYGKNGRVAEAEALLRHATEANPEYFQAWEALSYLLAQLGRIDEAIDAEKEAMRVREYMPSHGGENYAETLDLFGQLLTRRGRYGEAVIQFEHALRIKPGYTAAAEHLEQARRAWRDGSTQPTTAPVLPEVP